MMDNERKALDSKLSQQIKTVETNIRETMDRLSQLEMV